MDHSIRKYCVVNADRRLRLPAIISTKRKRDSGGEVKEVSTSEIHIPSRKAQTTIERSHSRVINGHIDAKKEIEDCAGAQNGLEYHYEVLLEDMLSENSTSNQESDEEPQSNVSKDDFTNENTAFWDFIFGCNIPVDVIDSKHFKGFMEKLNPTYAKNLYSKKNIPNLMIDRCYKDCVEQSKTAIRDDSFLLVNTPPEDLNLYCEFFFVISFSGKCIFLNTIAFVKQQKSTSFTERIQYAMNYAERIYKVNIIGVVTDKYKMVNFKPEGFFLTPCFIGEATSLAKEVCEQDVWLKSLVQGLVRYFTDSKHVGILSKKGGKEFKHIHEENWLSYKDALETLAENLDLIRNLWNHSELEFDSCFSGIACSKDFGAIVQDHVNVLKHIESFIDHLKMHNTSAVDATTLWLTTFTEERIDESLRDIFRKHLNNLLSKETLLAYFFHPYYDNDLLPVDRLNEICSYLETNLSEEMSTEISNYLNGAKWVKQLNEEDLGEDALEFWALAKPYAPKLSKYASMLLKTPATSYCFDYEQLRSIQFKKHNEIFNLKSLYVYVSKNI